jgi:hypothetical protein
MNSPGLSRASMRYVIGAVTRVRPTYRRSAAGARATAKPARQARLLQRLVSRLGHRLLLNPRDCDSLLPELCNEFERPAEGFDIPAEGSDLAVLKIGTSFKTRDVGLIDLGLPCDIDLGLADGIAQSPESKMNASRSTKAAAEYSDGLDLGLVASLS